MIRMSNQSRRAIATSSNEVRPGSEHEIVARLLDAVAGSGLTVDPSAITHFYVAVKSKPLTILAGPSQSGKIALVRYLAQALAGGDISRCQLMPGHAWWAGQNGNVGMLTEAQTRWNTSKILALIEEAWQPENADQVFIACLTRMSAAEVKAFFADVAFQIQRGELMRLPTAHFVEPIPYPPNLLLMGTIDVDSLPASDESLMGATNVIGWHARQTQPASDLATRTAALSLEPCFIRSCIRSQSEARRKLRGLLRHTEPMATLVCRVIAALRHNAVPAFRAIRKDMLIYLANAWDCRGQGLFDQRGEWNLAIALDWCLAENVFRHALLTSPRPRELKVGLQGLLGRDFPRAQACLARLE